MLKGYKEIAEMAYDDCVEALKTETDEEVRNGRDFDYCKAGWMANLSEMQRERRT